MRSISLALYNTQYTEYIDTDASLEDIFAQLRHLGWIRNKPYREQLSLCCISERALSTFNQRMNAFAIIVLERKKRKIGGPLVIIEIDEALLHRRKNFPSRVKPPGWVLGGLEHPKTPDFIPRTFFVQIEQRTREQLEALILANVEIGSIIIRDSFSSYYTGNHLENLLNSDTNADFLLTEERVRRWST